MEDLDEPAADRSRYSPSDTRLRDVEDDDVELFFVHQRQPEAARMAAFPSREKEPFIAHWAKIRADRGAVLQTIVTDGRVAGNIVSWEQRSGRRAVGYWIDSGYWGRGIATRALELFLAHVETRPLHAYVAADNIASVRVLEKCGFKRIQDPDVESEPDSDDVEELAFILEDTSFRSETVGPDARLR